MRGCASEIAREIVHEWRREQKWKEYLERIKQEKEEEKKQDKEILEK